MAKKQHRMSSKYLQLFFDQPNRLAKTDQQQNLSTLSLSTHSDIQGLILAKNMKLLLQTCSCPSSCSCLAPALLLTCSCPAPAVLLSGSSSAPPPAILLVLPCSFSHSAPALCCSCAGPALLLPCSCPAPALLLPRKYCMEADIENI